MLLFCIGMILLIISVRVYLGFYPKASSSNGAIVMASGIMINGAMQKVPSLAVSVGPYAAFALLPMIVWLAAEYIRDVFDGSFYKRHLSNPVQSFSTGTWVAALSITAVTLTTTLPSLRNVAVFLFILASLLTAAFTLLVIWNYVRLWSYPSRVEDMKGVLLLGCVAVQSIVVAGNKLYSHSFSMRASLFLIILGALFYLAGFITILNSFKDKNTSALVENWSNTNTIIHGAVSITGLAIVSSSIQVPDVAAVVWLTALFLLIIIEGIEIIRGIRRIKEFGWKKGICSYHPSQWSRNFTIGMFLAFTVKLPLFASFLGHFFWAAGLQRELIEIGKYVVIFLFLYEVCLAIVHLKVQKGKGNE